MADGDRILCATIDTSGLRVSRNRLIQDGPSFLMQWPGCPRNESTAVFQCECGRCEAYKVRDVYRGHVIQCLTCNRTKEGYRPKKTKRTITTHRTTANAVTSMTAPHREYWIWSGMISRCHNPRVQAFQNYGAKGIAVCERWKNSFAAFLEDMGERPSALHSIDRINPEGNYEPSNCRWATTDVQANNKRSGQRINGKTLGQIAFELGLPVKTIRERIRLGWSNDEVENTPRRCHRRSAT